MNKLFELRKQKKLTQEQMAELLEITKSSYQKLEYRERRLNEDTLRKLKVAFPELDLNEFLK